MTYAMQLDNSWEMMSEDEMYDVNGGGASSWDIYIGNAHLQVLFSAVASIGLIALQGAIAVALSFINAIPKIGQIAYSIALSSLKATALAVSAALLFGTDLIISVNNRTFSVFGKSVTVPTGGGSISAT